MRSEHTVSRNFRCPALEVICKVTNNSSTVWIKCWASIKYLDFWIFQFRKCWADCCPNKRIERIALESIDPCSIRDLLANMCKWWRCCFDSIDDIRYRPRTFGPSSLRHERLEQVKWVESLWRRKLIGQYLAGERRCCLQNKCDLSPSGCWNWIQDPEMDSFDHPNGLFVRP